LERCRRDLLDPSLGDVPVSAIAARWGLTNAAHFSRAFRAAYGASPVEYRRLESRSCIPVCGDWVVAVGGVQAPALHGRLGAACHAGYMTGSLGDGARLG
jgi:hypothetical protein